MQLKLESNKGRQASDSHGYCWHRRRYSRQFGCSCCCCCCCCNCRSGCHIVHISLRALCRQSSPGQWQCANNSRPVRRDCLVSPNLIHNRRYGLYNIITALYYINGDRILSRAFERFRMAVDYFCPFNENLLNLRSIVSF